MRLLMCPPDYFDVAYEINPWMHLDVRPNRSRAERQWNELCRILKEEIGAEVSLIQPQPGVPDMVFTANAGLVRGQSYIPSIFRWEQRRSEMPFFRKWFAENGFTATELTNGPFEGEGDALFYCDMLLAGYGPRTSRTTHAELARLNGRTVVSLGLVDDRYYHLDVCLAVLSTDALIYYPPAFDEASQAAILALPGEKTAITEADANHFGANCVVVGNDVVVNEQATELVVLLKSFGYRVHTTDLSEFVKAGGSAKCLTLILTSVAAP